MSLSASVPVEVTSTPGDLWWRIALDIMVALGTLGAAGAVWWASRRAGDIANKDRHAMTNQDEEERRHEREWAAKRYRLDELTALLRHHTALLALASQVGNDRWADASAKVTALMASADLPVDVQTCWERAPNGTKDMQDRLEALETCPTPIHE